MAGKSHIVARRFFPRLSWLFAPMAKQPLELSLIAQYMKTIRRGASEEGYSRAQFFMSNFLWHHSSNEEPEPYHTEGKRL